MSIWTVEPEGWVKLLPKPPLNWVGPQKQWEISAQFPDVEHLAVLALDGVQRPVRKDDQGFYVFTDLEIGAEPT